MQADAPIYSKPGESETNQKIGDERATIAQDVAEKGALPTVPEPPRAQDCAC
jgi:hypothetical protein